MSEPPDWYAGWADGHARAFMLPPAWSAAAVAWWEVFDALGATAAELYAATREMQVGTAPRWGGDHLPALKTLVGEVRDKADRDARRAAAGADDGPAVCVQCEAGSGWVLVPHPAHVKGGVWVPSHHRRGVPVRVTATVTCECFRGRKTQAETTGQGGKPPVSVERYRAWNRAWREQMRDHAAELAAIAGAESRATAAAEAVPTLARALAERTRL